MCQSLLAIKALGFQPTIAQHLRHLGIFLSIFAENKFPLVVVIFVLSTSPIFATLYFTPVSDRPMG
jgi:hypothetical protein